LRRTSKEFRKSVIISRSDIKKWKAKNRASSKLDKSKKMPKIMLCPS